MWALLYSLGLGLATAQISDNYQPVNKFFTSASVVDRPQLECQVGIMGMVVKQVYKVNCNEAWKISVELDQPKANELQIANYISDQDRIRKIIRFGMHGSGVTYEGKFNWKNWTRPVPNWTCVYTPYLGIVVYDCVPANEAPLWWDDSYMGPSFDDGVQGVVKVARPPGCNGAVCYCNHYDYCNDKWNITVNDYVCPEEIPEEYRMIDTRCIGDGKGKSPPLPVE